MSDKQGINNEKGKGKPPIKSQWKQGQSGNPKGRPKKDVSLTSLLKKYLDSIPDVKIDNKTNTDKTWRELIVQAWLVGSYKGNATLFKELLERVDGKVVQPITGGEGEPLMAPIVNVYMPDGTVVKPPRNDHEKEEVEAMLGDHSDNGQ